jgi:AraC-like DNA-binding protein
MKQVIHLHTISDIFKLYNLIHCHHPLIAVLDFSKTNQEVQGGAKFISDFYSIIFKNYCANNIKYGRKNIDFQDGSLMCISPGQVIDIDDEIKTRDDSTGWGVFFHPDLIRGTSLGNIIKNYSFFSYETNEALHLSDKEKQNLSEIVQKLSGELLENIDKHSQSLIVSNLDLLLNYCTRYYDRQFITRKATNGDINSKVERVLRNYFQQENLSENGLPTVKFLADQVHLSPNYLSDLLKRETGMNTQDRIHYYLIEEAKNLLFSSNKTVGELAFALGFEYPQYFSRLFKSKTGMTPLEYRNLN